VTAANVRTVPKLKVKAMPRGGGRHLVEMLGSYLLWDCQFFVSPPQMNPYTKRDHRVGLDVALTTRPESQLVKKFVVDNIPNLVRRITFEVRGCLYLLVLALSSLTRRQASRR
jgi:hypothetical protein